MEQKSRHSKMDNLYYCELKMQQYLKSNKFTTFQARTIFSFRTRMANFGENFGGQNGHRPCPICFLHLDNQPMALQCPKMKTEVKVLGKYEDIFDSNISMDIVNTICDIMKLRTKYEKISRVEEYPIKAMNRQKEEKAC